MPEEYMYSTYSHSKELTDLERDAGMMALDRAGCDLSTVKHSLDTTPRVSKYNDEPMYLHVFTAHLKEN